MERRDGELQLRESRLQLRLPSDEGVDPGGLRRHGLEDGLVVTVLLVDTGGGLVAHLFVVSFERRIHGGDEVVARLFLVVGF